MGETRKRNGRQLEPSDRLDLGDPSPGRQTERNAAERGERLLSGESWRSFCRALEEAGEAILGAEGREAPHVRAAGYRYLLGIVKVGIQQAAELDPERPRFIRICDSDSKSGGENADNAYAHAHIRGDRCYRIRGHRGTVDTFLIEIKEGFMQLGDARNFATMEAPELEVEADGTFELILGGEPRKGNWLPLDPDATQVLIRQYFCDWEKEVPAEFTIERIGSEGVPSERLEPEDVDTILEEASRYVVGTTSFWEGWVGEFKSRYDHDRIAPAAFYVGGADDIAYGNDYFEIDLGEAMIITFRPPRAKYWAFQLCDLWFKTMDWPNRKNSINHRQAHLDGDGLCRIVIAHEDPGVPNWLDTGGEVAGVLQYRWVWTEDNPQPTLERVAASDVRSVLPPDTPATTIEARRQDIHGRQRHRLRRERI